MTLQVESLLDPTLRMATKAIVPAFSQAAATSLPGKPFCAIECRTFPRGSFEALSPCLGSLHTFTHYYGAVSVRNLQNPDLKRLVKAHGATLNTLKILPCPNSNPNPNLNPNPKSKPNSNLPVPVCPKLQGCGYRWVAKHCKQLRFLSLPLRFDVKRQLLPRLHVHYLERICLLDLPKSYSVAQLRAFVKRCPRLVSLELHGQALKRFSESKTLRHGMKRQDGRVLQWQSEQQGRQASHSGMLGSTLIAQLAEL